MKPLTLFSILMLFGVYSACAQKIYTTEKDIFDVKELTFYGYDFSDWRLAETKRVDEDMRIYIFSWIEMMKDRMISEKLENWYVKDKVIINFAPTLDLAKRIIPGNLVTLKKHYTLRFPSIFH